MNKNVIKYMQKIGSKGGSAKTEKQREAHKLALVAARAKRWPGRAVQQVEKKSDIFFENKSSSEQIDF